MFSEGRARINLPLAREIAQALDVESSTVEGWIDRCHELRDSPSRPTAAVRDAPMTEPRNLTTPGVLMVALACLILNLAGRLLVDVLHLPFFLDMLGTAVAAILLGPWSGAAVGGASNVIGSASSGWPSLPFAAVNVLGALVWGYGVRRLGMGRTLPRFFLLNLVVAAVCSLVAVPILLLAFDGSVGHGFDTLTETLLGMGSSLAVAVSLSNLVTSVADKLLSGFVALVVIASVPTWLSAPTRLIVGSGSLPGRRPQDLAEPKTTSLRAEGPS